jgi:hypothetical protein
LPLFWPDLASIRNSRDTISWYEKNEVAYVKKIHNPLNSPKLHPIERYLPILKLNVKKRSSATSNIKIFKRKVDGAMKSIDLKVMQNLMSGVKGKRAN